MAEKIEIGGKSKYEVAHSMAEIVLRSFEKKDNQSISRNEYLQTVAQCVRALEGIAP